MAGADYLPSMDLASSACENDGSIAKTTDSPIEVGQNYPNPFNPTTEISFYLYESGHARLDIYNVAGQRVRTLVDEDLPSGRHVYEWDSHNDKGQRVASGIYLYRVISGGFVKTKKMVLLK
jgi:flagellar hook assembly protein FlgD